MKGSFSPRQSFCYTCEGLFGLGQKLRKTKPGEPSPAFGHAFPLSSKKLSPASIACIPRLHSALGIPYRNRLEPCCSWQLAWLFIFNA